MTMPGGSLCAGTCTLTSGGAGVTGCRANGTEPTARSAAVGTRRRGSSGARLRRQRSVPSASHSSHR